MRGGFGAISASLVGLLMVTACSQPQQPSPTSSTTTSEQCSAELTDTLGCEGYRSISATEDGAPIDWAAAGAIALQALDVDGARALAIGTPCNTFTIPVGLRGSIIVPGEGIETLMGVRPDANV
jgi:hypothetical protein